MNTRRSLPNEYFLFLLCIWFWLLVAIFFLIIFSGKAQTFLLIVGKYFARCCYFTALIIFFVFFYNKEKIDLFIYYCCGDYSFFVNNFSFLKDFLSNSFVPSECAMRINYAKHKLPQIFNYNNFSYIVLGQE